MKTPKTNSYPVLPLRDLVVFPGMIVPVLVGRPRSVKAVEESLRQVRPLLLVSQKDSKKEDPATGELYTTGVEAEVMQQVRLGDGGLRLLMEASRRAKIINFTQEEPWLTAEAEPGGEDFLASPVLEASTRGLLGLFEEFVRLNPRLSPETFHHATSLEDPGRLADVIASHLDLKVPDKQRILEAFDVETRLSLVAQALASENQILTLQRQIHGKVRKRIEKNQREHWLQEQMKAIQNELGQKGEDLNEGKELKDKISALKMPKESKEKALKEVTRMERTQPMSAEATVIRTWLDTVIALPWGKESKDNLDLKRAKEVLEEDHEGLDKPKDRILEHMAVRKLSQEIKGPILCFVGPPGVGKTSLARSIARAMGRKFERISLGGVRDEAEIRGHRRTYIGSMPGRLVQALKKAGTMNPVLLLDEVDKMSMDFRGDPSSALLEVLDPEQNHAFADHYLDLPLDLSQVLFISTANLLQEIPGPLRDRLEVIEIPGYLDDEKARIADRFLLPKLRKAHGLKEGQLKLDSKVMKAVIREYTREAGVRELERQLATLSRKAAKHVVEKGAKASLQVNPDNLGKFLGIPRFRKDEAEKEALVGVANGLAWTGAGGEVLTIEASLMPGKGDLKLTGTLGDVMKESAHAAFSWVRAHAMELGLAKDFHTKLDIHLHVPEGATPKDGPSAGVTMATALASALTGRPVRRDMAMTGEITLRGRVLPIGGLKEKSLAAHRLGIHTLLVPRANRKDLEEIPETVKKTARIHLVSGIGQVLKLALQPRKSSLRERRRREGLMPKVETWAGSELPN